MPQKFYNYDKRVPVLLQEVRVPFYDKIPIYGYRFQQLVYIFQICEYRFHEKSSIDVWIYGYDFQKIVLSTLFRKFSGFMVIRLRFATPYFGNSSTPPPMHFWSSNYRYVILFSSVVIQLHFCRRIHSVPCLVGVDHRPRNRGGTLGARAPKIL